MAITTVTHLALTTEVEAALDRNVPVAVGVSGGKDSVACALAVSKFLEDRGHTGPKLLIHADLGAVEWQDSFASCQRLANHLEWELLKVQRKAGGLMERWEARWASSKRRYLALECVKVILPWSTPSMRFCTSELKRDPIISALKKRWGKVPFLSVTGIRADESPARAKMPAAKEQPKAPKGSLDWNPILRWNKEQVFAEIAGSGLALHEAYTLFGSTRVSCVLCIMGSKNDLKAALKDGRNHEIYHRMCALELESRFSFQNSWLMELDPRYEQSLAGAQQLAAQRKTLESQIPKHLEFAKGWPEVMPTPEEAETLAATRQAICNIYQWEPAFVTAEAVLARYSELMTQKHEIQLHRRKRGHRDRS